MWSNPRTLPPNTTIQAGTALTLILQAVNWGLRHQAPYKGRHLTCSSYRHRQTAGPRVHKLSLNNIPAAQRALLTKVLLINNRQITVLSAQWSRQLFLKWCLFSNLWLERRKKTKIQSERMWLKSCISHTHCRSCRAKARLSLHEEPRSACGSVWSPMAEPALGTWFPSLGAAPCLTQCLCSQLPREFLQEIPMNRNLGM